MASKVNGTSGFDTLKGNHSGTYSFVLSKLTASEKHKGYYNCLVCGGSRMQVYSEKNNWMCYTGRCEEGSVGKAKCGDLIGMIRLVDANNNNTNLFDEAVAYVGGGLRAAESPPRPKGRKGPYLSPRHAFPNAEAIYEWPDGLHATARVVRPLKGGQSKPDKDVFPMTKQSDGWYIERGKGHWPVYMSREPIDGDILVICEGEKTADAISGTLGPFIGVTSQGGAKNAKNTDWNTLPEGHKVVLWPDNDSDGKDYIKDVLSLLPKDTEALGVIDTTKFPPKHDAADLVCELTPLKGIDAIQAVISERVTTADNWAKASQREGAELRLRRTGVVTLSKIRRQPMEYLIDGFIPLGETVTIAGREGSGKTRIGVGLQCLIAGRISVPGVNAARPFNKVACLSFEENAEVTLGPAYIETCGGDVGDGEWLLILNEHHVDESGNQVETRIRTLATLVSTIEDIITHGHRSILIDSLKAVFQRFGWDENDSNHCYEFYDAMNALCRRHCVSIMVVDHFGKNSAITQSGSRRVSGSASKSAAVRAVFNVEVDRASGSRFIGASKNNIGLSDDVIAFRTKKSEFMVDGKPSHVIIAEIAGINETETIDQVEERLKAVPSKPALKGPSKAQQCAEFITNFVTRQPDSIAAVKDVQAEALKAGYSKNSIDDAGQMIELISYKYGPKGSQKNYLCPHEQGLFIRIMERRETEQES
jgi:hypothetical protein